jgi:hypothetical protein
MSASPSCGHPEELADREHGGGARRDARQPQHRAGRIKRDAAGNKPGRRRPEVWSGSLPKGRGRLKPRADSRTLARREFNKLYRKRRLAAEAAGQAFITYNEAVALASAEVRERGRCDVDQLFDRVLAPMPSG